MKSKPYEPIVRQRKPLFQKIEKIKIFPLEHKKKNGMTSPGQQNEYQVEYQPIPTFVPQKRVHSTISSTFLRPHYNKMAKKLQECLFGAVQNLKLLCIPSSVTKPTKYAFHLIKRCFEQVTETMYMMKATHQMKSLAFEKISEDCCSIKDGSCIEEVQVGEYEEEEEVKTDFQEEHQDEEGEDPGRKPDPSILDKVEAVVYATASTVEAGLAVSTTVEAVSAAVATTTCATVAGAAIAVAGAAGAVIGAGYMIAKAVEVVFDVDVIKPAEEWIKTAAKTVISKVQEVAEVVATKVVEVAQTVASNVCKAASAAVKWFRSWF